MDILTYFKQALAAHHSPTLLQFTHPHQKTPLDICGINPTTTLVVKNGILFKDDVAIGSALDIFEHLKLTETTCFFPSYLGFFSYEFARYFGFATKSNNPFPDAFFRLYNQGLVIDNGVIIHYDPLSYHGPLHEGMGIKNPSTHFTPHMNQEQFLPVVADIKERILKGDVYQVNFSMPFYADVAPKDMLSIYEAMRTNNKSPFMGVLTTDDFTILSGSPERLFSLHNGSITTRPIAGTKKRHHDPERDNASVVELTSCPKENAEHVMLVDLLRNDLNHIAIPGSVTITEDRSVEFYSHVMHLVSEISGHTHHDLKAIMQAMFPGGTITGAPKERVMNAISELESLPRGPYTGSLGYISSGYGIDFNILIRSVLAHGEKTWLNAGAGIVIDSIAEQEWQEINAKAQAVKEVLLGKAVAKPPRELIKGQKVTPCSSTKKHHKKRVLFIENNDSFSYNIVEALRSQGAVVEVFSPHLYLTNLEANLYTHLLIGPGPGNPTYMPELSTLIDHAIKAGLPILGICLGHQALGYHCGARIVRAPRPIHGQSQPIHHFATGLFVRLSSPQTFTRYHSLIIDKAPAGFVVDAYSDDDCIMAIRHETLPLFGLQFHPESYVSSYGQELLHQFLSIHPCW